MTLNSDKFYHLAFSPNSDSPTYLKPSNDPIPTVPCTKDLGLLVQDNLQFTQHIATLAARANRISGWSLRTIHSRSTFVMKTLLKQVIICLQEYASCIWCPHDQHQINILEQVQRLFTKKFSIFLTYDPITNIPYCNTSYPERLKRLNLFSLQRRRERFIMMYMHKVTLDPKLMPSVTVEYNVRTKVHLKPTTSPKNSPTWVKKIQEFSIFSVGTKLYNSLPKELRQLQMSPQEFKYKLDKYLSTIPDLPGTTRNSLLNMCQ